MSKASKIGLYLTPDAARVLDANGGGRNRSHRINQVIDRYAAILRRTRLPDFAEAEWHLMQDAMNGTWHEPAEMIRGVWVGIEDAIRLDGLADKWGVDATSLIEKLKSLDYAQEVALVERIEGLWTKSDAGAA